MGRATPVYRESSSAKAPKLRPAIEVREGLSADAKKTLGSFARRVNKQRGLPSEQAKVRIK